MVCSVLLSYLALKASVHVTTCTLITVSDPRAVSAESSNHYTRDNFQILDVINYDGVSRIVSQQFYSFQKVPIEAERAID